MLAVLPSSAVDTFLAQSQLAKLPLDFSRRIEDYGVLTRRGEKPSLMTAEFIEIVLGERSSVPSAPGLAEPDGARENGGTPGGGGVPPPPKRVGQAALENAGIWSKFIYL